MKLQLIASTLWLATTAFSRGSTTPSRDLSNDLLGSYHSNRPAVTGPVLAADDLTPEEIWHNAVCKGGKLYNAMINERERATQFLNPIDSPWHGRMTQELYDWGWKDMTGEMDYLCDFDGGYHVKTAFEALGYDMRSTAQGGPNKCFHVGHQDSPKCINKGVLPDKQIYIGPDGKEYRATLGHQTMGVNPASGILFFIDRASPAYMAEMFWDYKPKKEELPQLQRSSDIAWGFWNRAQNFMSLSRINMIMSLNIVNPDTEQIIIKAMEGLPRSPGQPVLSKPPKWPGVEFVVNGVDEPGLALLGQLDAMYQREANDVVDKSITGSPNGVGAGFFLAQHKDKLGATKTINKITLFTPDEGNLPMMMMWVGNAPPPPSRRNMDTSSRARGLADEIVIRNWTKKMLVREHIIKV